MALTLTPAGTPAPDAPPSAHAPAALGRLQTIALYVGAIIGSGVLLIPAVAADLAGPASLIAWLGMTLMMVPQALTMAFLAARFPSGGGVSTFAREAFGPLWGAVTGWLFLLAVPIGAPIASLIASGYAIAALGLAPAWRHPLAAAILALVIATNALGVKTASRLQVIVVSGIALTLLGALACALPHVQPAAFTPFAPHGWVGVGQAAALLFWSYVGWEAVTHFSGEVEDPTRDLVPAVLAAALVVAVLYLGAAFVTVGMHAYGPGGRTDASFVSIATLAVGPAAGLAVGALALVAVLATSNAYVGAAAQLARALAEQGAAPAWLARSNARTGAPIGGLAFLAVSSAAVMAFSAAGATATLLIGLPTGAYIATYLLGSAAGLKLARTRFAWWMALLSLLSAAVVYPFLGWAGLYPPMVCLVGAWYFRRGARRPQDRSTPLEQRPAD